MGSKSRPSGTQTARAVEQLVADRLPKGWSLRTATEPAKNRRRRGAVWALRSPDGQTTDFVLEVVGGVVPRALPEIVDRIRTAAAEPLIAAPYLSPRAREVLTEIGAGYGDTTGNLRIVANRPALFIERQGTTKDPWPSDETLQSLRGRAAGRAVRALVDFRPPFGVRDLARRAQVSLGSLSRVIDLLDREALLSRSSSASGPGGVDDVDWAGVIRRWSQDYEFRRSNQVATYLEPRGLGALTAKLADARLTYAATGAFAAQRFAPVAPARTAAVYVEDIAWAAGQLELQPADAGANVLLAEPFDPVAFERRTIRDDLQVVATTQLAADLRTGPGREPSESEELLDWMGKNDDAWRT